MKKVIKKILIVAGILIGVIIIFAVIFILKVKSELDQLKPIETKKLVENVYTIKDGTVNMFLMKDSSNYIAIDAGNSKEAIEKGLKLLNIEPNKIVAVLLTHTDADHVSGLSLFKNAKVIIAKEEEEMINGKTSRAFGLIYNKIECSKHTLISEKEYIVIGNFKIKGILVQGHTTGSMCYVVNDKHLFVGDAASLKDGKIAPFNKFFNRDNDQAIKSMSNFSNLKGIEYVFTAHYGYGNYVDTDRK